MTQFTDTQAADGAFHQLKTTGCQTKEELAAAALYWSGQDIEQAKRVIKILIHKINGETMTQEPIWKDSNIIESGNYPKNSFTDVLKNIYVTENENLKALELRCEFESGKQVSTLMFNKERSKGVFENEDKVIVDGGKISKFIASIERLDAKTGQVNMNNNDPSVVRIKTQWAFLDGVPTGFRTIPDITGCTLSMVATLDKVGDDQQTSKYPDWSIGGVEGLSASKPAPSQAPKTKPAAPKAGKAPAKPAAPANDDLIIKIEDMLLENPTMTVGDIYAKFGGAGKSPYKPAEIREAIAVINAKGT
ncbi:MAG: hypothetical protein PHH85_09100 [Candidatus Methanoperedens sp.]|nr:hypothetical protein [Candidatus Methanoperedens sp.]